ncbi:polymorphic toxin-type HINT domain-containing protein [Nocardiopsis trehalosi]|uniref:polymorphic toxin-type HINT domain-containing protein n=1 Tax=Nocardiopsis trehalosi TaxID=109329 RepID=UPI0008337A2E|nr:polymorphic toxin-type HINT domain-containing protein [Nocardiopsis trehalosi]
MLRSIHDPDRGAGYVEYGAVILLVAAIAATVIGSGITGRIQQMITGAVDSVGQPQADDRDRPDSTEAPDDPADPPSAPDAPGITPAFSQDTRPSFAPLGLGSLLPGVDGSRLTYAYSTGDLREDVTGLFDDALASQHRAFGEGLEIGHETITGPINLAEDLIDDPLGTVQRGVDGAAERFTGMGTAAWSTFQESTDLAFQGYQDGQLLGGIFDSGLHLGGWGLRQGLELGLGDEAVEHFANGEIEQGAARTGVTVASWLIAGPAGRIGLSGLRLLPEWTGSARGPEPGSSPLANGPDRDPPGEDTSTTAGEDEDTDRGSEPCAPSNSFIPGTAVLLADGTTAPIEDVAVGDDVLAFDPLTGEEGPREVTDTITGDGHKPLVTLTIDTGDGTDTLTATDEHPFWVPEQAQWVDAIDLTPGTWLRTSTGTWTQITAVDVHETPDQRVHNLTIADLHTYYVGVDGVGWLVHNDNGRESSCPDWLRDRLEAGNNFNREREAHYTRLGGANEVHVGPRTSGNQYQRVDSYIPGREIVSRKYTQLSEIQESTAFNYLRELARDYGPGTPIADTPTNRRDLPEDLIGEELDGQMYLEVPVQNSTVPDSVISEANRLGIIIRDENGHIWR